MSTSHPQTHNSLGAKLSMLAFTIPETTASTERTTQEYVYERLRHAIMVGAITPGTNLTMRGLAEAMGLSTTPIREAVRRLSSENAVHIKENRRISIPDMTAGRFEELVELRVSLEAHAAARALPYISDIKIDQMTLLDDEMDNAMSAKDWNLLTTLNQDFHRTLYTVNPDQVVIPVIESIWLQLGPFQRQVIEHLEEFYKIDRHKEILSALRTRDAAALTDAIKSDIRETLSRAGRELLETRTSAA